MKLQISKKETAEAVKNREFCVLYQPQVNMITGEILGAEALVRWRRPGAGLLTPDIFIPALEKNGMMPLLDCEVLCLVGEDLHEAQNDGISFGMISVNLTRLHAGQYSGRYVGQCARMEIGEDILYFELTETAENAENEEEILVFAEQLKRNGFRIAMDDYGTGNSTLKMLDQISFDILKLDRYFVSRIGEEKAETILHSTISMAKKLGMEVVAEGVETREQALFLMENGCTVGQGYYYSRPLSKEQYRRYRSEGKRLPGPEAKMKKEAYYGEVI